jgi:hypothetical protein
MTTLPEYLQSARAREDVKAAISSHSGNLETACGVWQIGDPDSFCVWSKAALDALSVYYRPSEDGRFVVSDLGEGLLSYRKRSGELSTLGLTCFGGIWRELGLEMHGSTFTLSLIEASQLPDAICCVMLASHRVANLETK